MSYRNVTTGGPFVASPNPFGFAIPYVPNPDGTYDVDFVALFRYGAGRIDNINMTGNLVPEPTAAVLGVLGIALVGLFRRKH